jgi:hypothetical protein
VQFSILNKFSVYVQNKFSIKNPFIRTFSWKKLVSYTYAEVRNGISISSIISTLLSNINNFFIIKK